ncbi:hypothetical protein Ddye_019373, partial [Dipteronia dyeriana]
IESQLFQAKDITIVNTVGPEGEKAVALRTTGNYITNLRCSIEGFQNTLYAHQGKSQFFFNCDIYVTIDFIIGNATVIIQNSTIRVRHPLHGQQNVITVDGRDMYNSNTTIVIQNCSIVSTPDLQSQTDVKTYLGRPWKKFSQTIIMQHLDTFVDRECWTKFDESSDVTTLHYFEI